MTRPLLTALAATAPPTVVYDPAAAGTSFFGRPLLLWLLLLVPLTALVAWLVWRRRGRAEQAWAARGLRGRLLPTASPARRAATVVLLTLAVAGTALALARPRWGAVEHVIERRGVDVVFVLDSSLSMGARDVAPSRLFVAKSLIRQMARKMPSNRVALVAAEGRGEVLTPLTLDGAVLDLLLDTVEPGSLPVPGTELAPSLVASLELFPAAETGHQTVVLVSDGEDHGDGLTAAAERLHDRGVVVHTVGVATADGAPVPLPDSRSPGGRPGIRLPGSRSDGRDGFKRDDEGKAVISRLGEEALARPAEITGGRYLAATSAAADIGPIVDAIAAMETKALEGSVVETREERFQWPLGLAALALVLYLALGGSRPRTATEVPARAPTRAPARPATGATARHAALLAALLATGTAAATATAQPPARPTPPPAASPPDATEPGGDEGRDLPAARWRYNPRQQTGSGIEAWDEGRFADADADLTRALELSAGESDDPDPLPLLNAGTGRLAGGGDPGGAGRLLAAAAGAAEARLATGRGDAELAASAHYNLGNALYAGGDYAGAAEAYRQALRRSPDRRAAKHNLELALARLQEQQQGSGGDRNQPQDTDRQDQDGDPQSGDGSEQQGEQQNSQAPEQEQEQEQEDPQQQQQQDGSQQEGEDEQRRPGKRPEDRGEQPPPRRQPSAGEGEPAQRPENDRRLPGFEDQPDMDAEQAASILEAVENLERQRRREEAARRARRIAEGKDW